MTPPVHDREQAIERVQQIPLPFVAEFKSGREQQLVACLGREGAERIVDALLGQPDQEVERLKRVILEADTSGQWSAALDLIRAALDQESERAERAEERLRAVELGARHVVDSKAFYVSTLGGHGRRSLALLLSAIDDLKKDLDRVLSGAGGRR